MGYDHYWLAVPKLPQREWDRTVEDFAKVAAGLHKSGLRLAGPDGTGRPVLGGDRIAFNGVLECGHRRRRAWVMWPGRLATGVSVGGMSGALAVPRRRGGVVHAPPLTYASARTCNGSCAAGAFVLDRIMPDDDYTKVYGDTSPMVVNNMRLKVPREWTGKYFAKCSTAYRPYDLAVCCCLIAAKRRFGSLMVVASDGSNNNWSDARELCQDVLGYGGGMLFAKGTGHMRCAAGARTPAAPDVSGRHVPVYSPDGDARSIAFGTDGMGAGVFVSLSHVEPARPSPQSGSAPSGAGRNGRRRRGA